MRIQKQKDFNILSVIFTVFILVIVFGMISYAIKSAKPIVDNETLKISGLYKVELKMDQIQEITLKEKLPSGFGKTNGIDMFGKAYIGNFKAEGYDKIRACVLSGSAPYIYITTKNNEFKYIILNMKDKTQTMELYGKISAKVKK
jgi:hypothetical protein